MSGATTAASLMIVLGDNRTEPTEPQANLKRSQQFHVCKEPPEFLSSPLNWLRQKVSV